MRLLEKARYNISILGHTLWSWIISACASIFSVKLASLVLAFIVIGIKGPMVYVLSAGLLRETTYAPFGLASCLNGTYITQLLQDQVLYLNLIEFDKIMQPISKGGLFAGPISADVGSDRIWLVSVKGIYM